MQEEGKKLEVLIHNILKPVVDNIVSSDHKIVKLFGKEAFGIDHYIEVGKDKMILIQDKWEETSPNMKAVSHFVRATEYINNNSERKLIMALYVSKKPMSKTFSKKIFETCDIKNPSNIYHDINNSISIEELATKTKDFVTNFLVSYGLNKQYQSKKLWILYKHQQDALECFLSLLDPIRLLRGIVCHPTGAGKMVLAFAMTGHFLKQKKSVMWVTRRKDVLKSHFDDKNKMDICVKSFMIPYQDFIFIRWDNKKSDIDCLNEALRDSKPVLLVTNEACITYGERYKQIDDTKFSLIIHDECHAAGAFGLHSMFFYMIENWLLLEALIGFSATPLPTDKERLSRIVDIYGDGKHANFIHQMSFIEAIDREIIVPPEYVWVEVTLDEEISFVTFNKYMGRPEYTRMMSYIEETLRRSKTKQCLAWAPSIKHAEEWKKVFELCKQYKSLYPAISTYDILITHTKNPQGEQNLNKFLRSAKPTILIAVGQCIEGFDKPSLDTIIRLGATQSIAYIKGNQQNGRPGRTFPGKDKCIILDLFTMSDEEEKLESICNQIVAYCFFLSFMSKKIMDKDKEFNKMIKCLDIEDETVKMITPKGKTIEFSIKSTSLKSVDWKNLPDILKKKVCDKFYKNVISYTEAKRIVSERKIQSKAEYYRLCQEDPRLPEDPEGAFRGRFVDWIEYLGLERNNYVSLQEYKNAFLNYDTDKLKLTDICICLEKQNGFPPVDLVIDMYKLNRLNDIISQKNSIKITEDEFDSIFI